MPEFYAVFCLLLDIAPLSWTPLFLLPVLIIGIVVAAVAVLVQVIKDRQERISAQFEERRDKDPDTKEK